WALAALAAGLVPCGRLAARHEAGGAPARGAGGRIPGGPASPPSGGRAPLALALTACGLAVAAAASLAFAGPSWALAWAPWPVAAVAVLLAGARGPLVRGGRARPGAGAGAALVWSAAVAVLTLLLVKPNADDAYYLRQAAWIAEHRRFPLRDTLHSHDVLPAAFSPPLPSWEALLGSLAGLAGVSVPVLAHLLAAPFAAALAVLALWRLLRAWEVRLVARALSVALVFLLLAVDPAEEPGANVDHLPGEFFVTRVWQGKVILVAVLVPLLFALLHEHAWRLSRRGVALLAAAGLAAVGLSTTALFLVPVVALAYLAPCAARAPRRAAAGVVAASAYPAAAMAFVLASGGRQPARWRPQDIAPEALVLPAVGSGLLALVAVTAALAGPLLLAPCQARLGTVAAALAAALAFLPGMPQLLYELTGLGRPLWRLMWAMPVAALVGVLAAEPLATQRNAAARLLPALAVGALVALVGTPVWQGRSSGLTGHPVVKRDPAQLAVAQRLSGAARAGDVVLAPAGLSSTLLMLDGRVTAVAPRLLYTRALPASRSARRSERLLLWSFANAGLTPDVREDRVEAALRALGVDIAGAGPAPAPPAAARRLRGAVAGSRLLVRLSARRRLTRSRGGRARHACGSAAARRRRSARTAPAGGS
ncbi:MAG TPA: DUF6077 domain-containing protein, partial [Solirubrobacteraceae bacterium]|nr:DUF6077 domain-containing protein [Solirubrobacteraceae bacterium]